MEGAHVQRLEAFARLGEVIRREDALTVLELGDETRHAHGARITLGQREIIDENAQGHVAALIG